METKEALSLINSSVRDLSPYHLVREECDTKLNQNENPCDWPEEIKKQAAQFCLERPWNRYPNFIPENLKTNIARYIGVDAQSVIVGNGSNEMLLVLLLAFAAKAKNIVICSPTFTVYKLLCEGGMSSRTVYVSLTAELEYDVEAIKTAVTANPGSMLIICSPNNPVGNTISEDDFKSILEVHTGACILDQAYAEFGGFDGVALLPLYPNLIIVRTFSKAMAAAGLRLGYMAGGSEMIAEINKIKLPYNINFFTEYTASLILSNTDWMKTSVNAIIEERDSLYKFLLALPFTNVYKSAANFILVRAANKKELFEHLKQCGILVRDVSSYHLLEGCLRISVGTKDENAKLREAVQSFFS
ncbi:MAG: histidinol-phosphate transaminase [Chitinispirillales bacterium]|jgi:histidinol-phosphate aminotransferase|nr:histidinol-phosphate transaminase [Chitinispirillales bacterium]